MMSTTNAFPRCGVSYVAVIEQEYMHANKLSICSNCLALAFHKSLKRCNGCHLVDYCSRECQRAQWSKHKAFCNMVQGKGKRNAYLTSKDHDDALRILIDTYRLRVETDHSYREEDHGVYYPGKSIDNLIWAKGDATEDFQRFIDLTEVSGILPEWWRFEDRMECLALAVDKDNPESILKALDQSQLIMRYEGDTAVRNAMCILAELVVGYDGKGPAKDDEWYVKFSEHLDLHPEERARLIKGTIDAVKSAYEQHGDEFAQQSS